MCNFVTFVTFAFFLNFFAKKIGKGKMFDVSLQRNLKTKSDRMFNLCLSYV